jgi:hypothetical protein
MELTKRRSVGGALFASELPHIKSLNNGYSTLARANESFIKANGKRKAFLKGGNSSCRTHIRQHYELYVQKCEKENVPVHHWAIPREIWRVMEEEKEANKRGQLTQKQQQQQLSYQTVTGPREFTRVGVLHAVTKLIATDNQVSINCHCNQGFTHNVPVAACSG